MTDVERRADLRLVRTMAVVSVAFLSSFTVISGDVVVGVGRGVGRGVGAVVLAALVLAVGAIVAMQAGRLGAMRQRRSFVQAIRKGQRVPDDADASLWRPEAKGVAASLTPGRTRVLWVWFGLSFAVALALSDGRDNPLALLILGAVGAVLGLIASPLVMVTTRQQRANTRDVLRQLDDRDRGRSSA